MLIKFINRGKGNAKSAEVYLLQEHDHKGEVRADIKVLRGNPSHVSELADSLEFVNRYSSAVIAWHVDDAPTDKQITEVLNDFERVAFAGLEPNQYSYYAVLHEESNGSKHIHVIVPRVELITELSLNVAPPNWQKTYDVLMDKHNVKHNWASPKDLSRRKLVNNQVSVHSNMTHTKAKVEINKAVMELVEQGTIENEEDVIKYLNSLDGVSVKPRRSKKNLSIEMVGIKKPIRLEGLVYAKGFKLEQVIKEFREDEEQRARESAADRAREYERVSGVFENIISDRAKFNQGRYGKDAPRNKAKQSRLREELERSEPRDIGERRETQANSTREPNHAKSDIKDKLPRSDRGNNRELQSNTRESHPSIRKDGNRITEETYMDYFNLNNPHSNSNIRIMDRVATNQDTIRPKRNKKHKEPRKSILPRRRFNRIFEIRKKYRQRKIEYDRDRNEIEKSIKDARTAVQRGIDEYIQGSSKELIDTKERVDADNIKSREHNKQAKRNIKEIHGYIDGLVYKHRRQTNKKIREQSRGTNGTFEEVRGREESLKEQSRGLNKKVRSINGQEYSITEQSQELDAEVRSIGEQRQGLSGTVEKFISRVVEQIKKLREKIKKVVPKKAPTPYNGPMM